MARDKLRASEKAAAIVISIGAENAAKVYKYLKEEEIEQLSLEVSKLQKLSTDEMKDITDDFYGLCVTQKVITEGGVEYAKDVLEKAFGQAQAYSFMERVSKSLRTKAFDFVRKADSKNLLLMIQSEHPQTIAVILSYARAGQAAEIISELPQALQVDIIDRIANLDRASPEIIGIVEKTLEKKFSSIISVDLMELGGVGYIADIMNHVDRSTEKYIFDGLESTTPGLADEIKKLMFVFEDIVYMDDMSIQRFLRDVETKDLAIALKVTNDDVKNVIFKNMSQRVRETIINDIQYLHNVRMRDVEAAQQRIVQVIRRLEETEEVVISKNGKDDIIV